MQSPKGLSFYLLVSTGDPEDSSDDTIPNLCKLYGTLGHLYNINKHQ